MNEFTVHLILSASMNIFLQNTLSTFKIYFKEEIILEWDWRVVLSEITFRQKKIKWKKLNWK